jgi:cysteine desulfurase
MKKFTRKTIYLDNASATPIDKKVANLVSLYEKKFFSNPSSIHKGGVEARTIIDVARAKIASLIYAHSDEIIFTGSGTESDALAITGIIHSYKGNKIPHIITSSIEHPAVIEVCKKLENNKEAKVSYIDPDANGMINPKDIRDSLKENTVLVSIMYANNEIGTIQPIMEIAKAIRYFRKINQTILPFFHTDACQAINYLPIENIEKLGVDLLTFNSSKIYGPKGIGILYKKRGINLMPLYTGGGQEFGLRSGTENTAGIAGAALAFEETLKIKNKESDRLVKIRDYGIKKLLALSNTSGYEIILNGDSINRLPNNINISIKGISSELLVIELDAKGIEVSAKSACKSDEPDESYVISALRKAQGILENTTDGSIRISLGRGTLKSDIDTLVLVIKEILKKYKEWK